MDSPPIASEQLQPADQTRWFAEEVHPHDGQLKAYLRVSFPSVRDVEDVVQESYLRIWKARAAQPIQSAKAFLFMVARHVALDLVRRDGRSPLETGRDSTASFVLDRNPDAAATLISKDTLHHLADAIVALPERWREVLILHKLGGLSQKDVAGRLGLSERTVEKYCLKGLGRCEQYLRGQGIRGFQS